MTHAIALEMRALQYAWPSTPTPTLQIPEFVMPSGEHVFLHGPSGSGKSTLLALVAGILQPQSGELKVLGQALGQRSNRARDRFRADSVGLIFQQFNLIPYLTAWDNTLLPCQLSRSRRQRAEAAGGVAEQAEHLLTRMGIVRELFARPVTQLSIGQQQRVAAARALMGTPALIIADEPTSALDRQHRSEFIELLFELSRAQNSSILFVSHDDALAPLFKRRVHLDEINQVARHAA